MRILAIGLMCATMICFTGQDTCAKWLSASLPIAQIVWARYVGASLIALVASRSLSRPAMLRSRRPRLQLLRSVLLFCSTTANVFAVRELQLSETATISFLTPVFVALLAGPVLGERVSRGTHDRDRARISRRGDRYAPGSRGVSADRSRRGRRGCLQFGIRAGHPETGRIGLSPRRRSPGPKSPASCSSLRYCHGSGGSPSRRSSGWSWREWAFSRPPAMEC